MRILVVEEKYSNRYFVIEDKDSLGRIAIKLLRERLQLNYFPTVANLTDEKDRALERFILSASYMGVSYDQITNMSQEELNALPEILRTGIEATRQSNAAKIARIEQNFEEELTYANELESLLNSDNPDLKLAVEFLNSRNDQEYETFYEISTEDVD